ncbi:MAG TPA: arsenate reductase (glutaredoxin) [Flavobacterium sp.]|jgi:arsenate reductase
MIYIYHNSRCGKSRECLLSLSGSGKQYTVRNYLEDKPSIDELQELLKKLGIQPLELVRQKEKVWIENYKDLKMTNDEIIQAMAENPILIERPIVINGDKAVIARPAEKALDIL